MVRTNYHHGDLRAALIVAAREITAEKGVGQVSVAEVARRAGVSGGAPYRHFADRRALVSAVAIEAARSLTEAITAAISAVDGQALVVAGQIYVTTLIRDRAGIDVIYAAEIAGGGDVALADAGRALTDVLLPLALDLRPDFQSALRLMEQVLAVSHGYAALYLSGFLNRSPDALNSVVDRTADAIRTLIASGGEYRER